MRGHTFRSLINSSVFEINARAAFYMFMTSFALSECTPASAACLRGCRDPLQHQLLFSSNLVDNASDLLDYDSNLLSFLTRTCNQPLESGILASCLDCPSWPDIEADIDGSWRFTLPYSLFLDGIKRFL